MQTARAANGRWPLLHQIAHVQVVDAADIPRFAALGVMANMQPLWACYDPSVPDLWLDLIGESRARRIYPFASLINAAAPWCLLSDWPVSTLNPFQIMQTAVTRQSATGTPREAFFPAEPLTIAQALTGYTTGAAAACWRGQTTGALSPGHSADILILDRNILTCAPEEIGSTTVLLTLLAGQEVYRDAGFDG